MTAVIFSYLPDNIKAKRGPLSLPADVTLPDDIRVSLTKPLKIFSMYALFVF